MANLLYLLGIITVAFAASLTPREENSNIDGGISPNVVFVANVDGKSFFIENEPKRNWTEASKYCTSMGMTLASITSQEQVDALESAYGNVNGFVYNYWTSGRDSGELSQFRWNTINEQPGSFIRYGNHENYKFPTCLIYMTNVIGSSDLHPLGCSSETGTLCETV